MSPRLQMLLVGGVLAFGTVAPVMAADPPTVDIRSLLGSARLGAGYAQMIGIAAVPGISAANYDIDSDADSSSLTVTRLPYSQRWMPLSDNADLYWSVAAGYMRFKNDFSLDVFQPADGSISSKWTGYSGGAGLLAKVDLGQGFVLVPELDLAIARLENSAGYGGAAAILQPSLDGLLFNWGLNAWIVTPSLGIEWGTGVQGGTLRTRGRVSRSWISSFNEPDPALAFDEAVNIYSIAAEYARQTDLRVFDRPLSWVVRGGFFGFFGANRDALGFDSVVEVGGGIALPIAANAPDSTQLRLIGAYLIGPDVTGWSVGLSLGF